MSVKCEYYSKLDAPWQNDKTWLANIDSSKIPPDSYTINEVTEFAQTDSGVWYPKVIKNTWRGESSAGKERSSTKNIYLNTNPIFPEGIFNPENLPNLSK